MRIIYWIATKIAQLLCWLGNWIHKQVPNKPRKTRR